MRKLAAPAALLVGVVGAGGPASAAAFSGTKTVPDPVGDAPAAYDVTQVRYRNDGRGLSAEARVRDLGTDGKQVFVVYVAPDGGRQYSWTAFSVRRPDGAVRTVLKRFDGDFTGQNYACGARSRWDPDGDAVRLRLPSRCFDGDGPRRVWSAIGPVPAHSPDASDQMRITKVPFG